MYVKDHLSDDLRVYFTQETQDKSSTMIVFMYQDELIELHCTAEQVKKIANDLLESINKFESKYLKKS